MIFTQFRLNIPNVKRVYRRQITHSGEVPKRVGGVWESIVLSPGSRTLPVHSTSGSTRKLGYPADVMRSEIVHMDTLSILSLLMEWSIKFKIQEHPHILFYFIFGGEGGEMHHAP